MFKNYLNIAWRNLIKNKIYSFINIGGLVLGILGSIIIFQFVTHHLGTDTYHTKFEDIYRVVMDLHLDDGHIQKEKGSPFILHQNLKNDLSGIEHIAYIGQQELTIAVTEKDGSQSKYLEKEAAAFINEDYFNVFDYHWVVGNASLLNAPNSVVLTEKYAKKYFGNSDPVHQTFKINNLQDLQVVGILKDYQKPTDLKTEVFISLPSLKRIVPDQDYSDWTWFISSRETYIALKPNTSKQHIQSQLAAFSKKYYGEMAKYYQFRLQSFSDVHFDLAYGGKIGKSSVIIFSFVGILLIIISCINFINLSTVQSFKRNKEIGIRKTLGSTPVRIFGQFFTEITLITFISVLLALFLAYAANPITNHWLNLEISFSRFFDFKLLIFTIFLILFTIITAGFYPAFLISKFNTLKALKGIHQGSGESISVRKGLVIIQFCISFVLIAISILVVVQIDYITHKDIGSAKDLILHVKIPTTKNNTLTILKNQLLQKSFVQQISFSRVAPSSPMSTSGTIKFDSRDWEKFIVRSKVADANYMDTYQLKLLYGRRPIASDTLNEILINQKLIRDLGLQNPDEALNRRLMVGTEGDKTGIIVGIVADFNYTDLYSDIEPTIIYSSKDRYKQVAIKLTNLDFKRTINEISKIWQGVYPNNVFEYSFYDKELASFYQREVLTRSLIISFAVVSIFISCLGLFGLVGLTISNRIKEISIRKVLGARLLQLITLLSIDFLKLVLIAIFISAPVAYFFMHKWLQGFAYRTEISWWIFVTTGSGALFITLCIASYQAIKASLINPIKSLKTE